MLSTKLERFIAKRVLIICGIMAILSIVFFYRHIIILPGLATGTVFSLLRLNSYAATFSKLLSRAGETHVVRKSIIRFVINSVMIVVILAASLNFNQWFFIGVVEGIFTVPLVIIINGITEALGITRNNFE